jgi:hypothetical protein
VVVTVRQQAPRQRFVSRRLGAAWLVALALGGAAFLLGWAWSSPWDRSWWPLGLVVAAWVVLLVGAAGSDEPAKTVAVATMGLVTIAFVVVTAWGLMSDAKADAAVDGLRPLAEDILDGSTESGCEAMPALDLDLGGQDPPGDVCVVVGGQPAPPASEALRVVEFRWGDRALAYRRSGTWISGKCIRPVDDQWTLTAPLERADCPAGFTFDPQG